MSVRLRLTLSYAGFLLVAGALLLTVVWVFLLRYVPAGEMTGPGPFVPNRGDLVRAFTPRAVWAMVFLLIFGLVGGWILSGRMLAPLTRITQATRSASAGSLSHRIDLPGRADEFRELADSFDAMLARLEAQVAEQRRFAANASHELRTPLAISQTLLEVARKEPTPDVADLVDRLSAVNARAIALTEALLTLSRADQRSFPREELDLSLLVEEAGEALLPLAEENRVALTIDGEVTPIRGSHPLLVQLVSNLLTNAILHNLPTRGSVSVATSARSGHAEVVVENTGDHVDPQVVTTLTEPFQRGTERIRSDHAGVGLGLAIAKSIVAAHDGSLSIAARPEGGLRVTVRIPVGDPIPRRLRR